MPRRGWFHGEMTRLEMNHPLNCTERKSHDRGLTDWRKARDQPMVKEWRVFQSDAETRDLSESRE